MGFYAPAQLIRDLREHGAEVRAADINASQWDNVLEPDGAGGLALRIGFRQIDGFREEWAVRLVAARAAGAFTKAEDLVRRANLPRRAMRLLADADAFRSIGQDRRQALWDVRRLPAGELPLFATLEASELAQEGDAPLPPMPLSDHVVADYQTTRFSLKEHPMAFLRAGFEGEGVLSCAQTDAAKDGARVRTAGVVLTRQRPGKGNAIFITIEDETGIVNALLWARHLDRLRRPVMASRLMLIEGVVQRSKENVVHLMAENVIDRTGDLERLSQTHAPRVDMTSGDGGSHRRRAERPNHRHPRDARILPKSRDFH